MLDRRAVEARDEAIAQEWLENRDPLQGVGARHHVVPAFWLRRFANPAGQLRVRDRATGAARLQAAADLGAIKDFYTIEEPGGSKDGTFEQLFAMAESDAATLFNQLLNPFRRPAPLGQGSREFLANFLALQMLRGPRTRRTEEMLADYAIKLQAEGTKYADLMRGLTAVPHPNEHLRRFGEHRSAIAERLVSWDVTLVVIDQPLFITCDEPVIVFVDGHVQHLPSCTMTTKQRAVHRRKGSLRDRYRDIVHVYPTKPSGVDRADGVGATLTPRTLLLLRPPAGIPEPQLLVAGDDAVEVAQEVNARLIDQAYGWVAAHPDHPTFADETIPEPGPLLGICDGGRSAGKDAAAVPSPRNPLLLGRR